ncbi:hypothetical protein [Sphingobium cloacae]|uniref:hypothetical protein n=1 Tax=Sphingobium cloacae TaxID=120107 RepID=UPI0008364D95|nr:hypothetical protein [Sphingobium cloacae]
MHVIFPESHAYPGCQVVMGDDARPEPECLVEFGDGVTVIAEWRKDGDTVLLMIPDYRTGKGTKVAARTWRIAQRKDGNWRAQRAK